MLLRPSPVDDPARRGFLGERNSVLAARRGELVDALAHPGVVAEADGAVVGALTYIVEGDSCEIVTLHAAVRTSGVGTALVDHVAQLAATTGCTRYWVLTTNDNLDALRFYQRRGFRLSAVHFGAVDEARRTLKPTIPLLGDYGIPIRDEVELEQELGLPSKS